MKSDQRVIVQLFVALVASMLVAAALVVGLALVRFQATSGASDRLDRIHLRTMSIANDVSAAIALSIGIVSDVDDPERSAPLPITTELTDALELIDEGVKEIVAVHSESGKDEFDVVVDRVQRRAEMIAESTVSGEWTQTQWLAQLAAIDFSNFQLGRLHSAAAEDELRQIARRDDQLRTAALVLVPALMVVVIVLVVRLFTRIRHRLRLLDAASDELIETQRRLEQSRKMEALGTLAGGIAHDFNNLLTVILGYAEVTQQRVGPDNPAFQPLQRIQAAGEQASNLTGQLLAFSRQEPARASIIDLNLLIRDTEPLLRGLIRGDIDFEIATAPDLGSVAADPAQVEQVLMNLVVNARDAMPHGGTLLVRTDNVVIDVDAGSIAPGSYSRIRVADTGHGMAPHVVERAVEPFYTTKDPGRGTGLGLSTVDGIVAKSDGYLDISSTPAVGSRFDVYLPHASAVEPADAPTGRVRTPSRGSETIVVVEDEVQIRDLIRSALEDLGYDVHVAADAESALAVLDQLQRPVDLLLTDVVMPGLRGPELVELVREEQPSCKVVYMSGYTADAVLAAVQASGEPFIPKPFKLRNVVNVLRDVLDRDVGARAGGGGQRGAGAGDSSRSG